MKPDTLNERLILGTLTGLGQLYRRRTDIDLLVIPGQQHENYVAAFAVSPRSLEQVFRLRFEVFNMELGEGLAQSLATGLDCDEYDDQMTHLVLFDQASGRIVGTYRMQTVQRALLGQGLYSAREYEMAPLTPYFDRAAECGRACLARDHRGLSALHVLWRGLAAFLEITRTRYLFGCCSITTTDPDHGWRAMKTIRQRNYMHSSLHLRATRAFSCGNASREFDLNVGEPLVLPKLFRAYVQLGARVISEPALDAEFGTVDFLVMLDLQELTATSLASF